MQMRKEATVSRDVDAREIPSGTPITLRAGDPVVITQSLGGSYTVLTPVGFLARIDGKDADAIGEAAVDANAASGEGKTAEEQAWDQLKTCYDPEIPVNIVDLGLVYRMDIVPLPQGGNRIDVEMTMTAPGCGMGEFLKADAEEKLHAVPGVREVRVEIVWEPAWDRDRMSEAARLQLGML